MNSWARTVGIQLMLAFVLAGASVINRGTDNQNGPTILKNIQTTLGGKLTKEITYMKSNQSKWFEIGQPMEWNDAVYFCKERHGNLATIETQDDVNLAKQMIKLTDVTDTSYWIGGTNTGSTRGYYWLTNGRPITSFWVPGQPGKGQPGINNSCMGILANARVWGLMNYVCGGDARPICEYY